MTLTTTNFLAPNACSFLNSLFRYFYQAIQQNLCTTSLCYSGGDRFVLLLVLGLLFSFFPLLLIEWEYIIAVSSKVPLIVSWLASGGLNLRGDYAIAAWMGFWATAIAGWDVTFTRVGIWRCSGFLLSWHVFRNYFGLNCLWLKELISCWC